MGLLAILEYVNDAYLSVPAQPLPLLNAPYLRLSRRNAFWFFNIRNELPMNCRAKNANAGEGALKDIARIDAIWSLKWNSIERLVVDGSGRFFDAMFAPVALRKPISVKLSDKAQQYQQRVLNSPSIKKWLAEASLKRISLKKTRQENLETDLERMSLGGLRLIVCY